MASIAIFYDIVPEVESSANNLSANTKSIRYCFAFQYAFVKVPKQSRGRTDSVPVGCENRVYGSSGTHSSLLPLYIASNLNCSIPYSRGKVKMPYRGTKAHRQKAQRRIANP
jgi:hypothetical protein